MKKQNRGNCCFLVQGWFKLANEIAKCGVANTNDFIICYTYILESDITVLSSH